MRVEKDKEEASKAADNSAVSGAESKEPTAAEKVQQQTRETLQWNDPKVVERLKRRSQRRWERR